MILSVTFFLKGHFNYFLHGAQCKYPHFMENIPQKLLFYGGLSIMPLVPLTQVDILMGSRPLIEFDQMLISMRSFQPCATCWFLDAITAPSTYPCRSVSQSDSQWVMFSDFEDRYRIYRACERVIALMTHVNSFTQ